MPGYNIFLCISNASQSDRAKSKLEYCGATWLQKRLAVEARDYSGGAHNLKRGSNPESTGFPISNSPI